MGRRFGATEAPLLVSVRSGAAVSMPGMMDTVLNLGLNDQTVEALAQSTGNRRFAFDSYRRFLQMYSDVVLDMDREELEERLEQVKDDAGVFDDNELEAGVLEGLTVTFKQMIADKTGRPFPQDPQEQLWSAISAVFRSWIASVRPSAPMTGRMKGAVSASPRQSGATGQASRCRRLARSSSRSTSLSCESSSASSPSTCPACS